MNMTYQPSVRRVRGLGLGACLAALCLFARGDVGGRGDGGASGDGDVPGHLGDGWELVWEDGFSGGEIDATKWRHCPEWVRQGGGGRWSHEDAYVDGDGKLIVRIRRTDEGIRSGALRTEGLFSQKFGYFEIRCKVPVIRGGWAAFWMMPVGGVPVGKDRGREGTEIDVFESIYAENGNVHHALHWGGYGEEHEKEGIVLKGRPELYEGYHTYGVLWDEGGYVFYIDGEETWRSSAGGVMRVPAYLKVSIEAAKWAGDIDSEELPKHIAVDYVRAYRRKAGR